MTNQILGIENISFNDGQKDVKLTRLYYMFDDEKINGAGCGSVTTPLDMSHVAVGDVVNFDYKVNPTSKKASLIGVSKVKAS